MNITEFLEARIAEDEAAANDATGARWVVLSGVNASMVNIDPTNVRDEKWKYGRFGHIATTSHDAAYAEHISRHAPARVLAECAAKRALSSLHSQASYRGQTVCNDCGDWWDGSPVDYPCATIKIVAAVYAGHPDYQQEWAA